MNCFEKFSEVKFSMNFDLVLDQSTREFESLLKTSAARFPAKISSFQFVSRKTLPEAPSMPKASVPSVDSVNRDATKNSLPNRPSIDIEDKLVTLRSATQTVPTLIDTSHSPVFNNFARSEPAISTHNFPRKCNRKYTLVLDLDETLIHFKNDLSKPKFLIRPYAYSFLKNLSSNFEIIIFTAAQKEYADWILDKIDSKNNIVHRLYREHCQMSKTSHLKDLGLLGRDLSKTIIVDNFAENFALHKENGICIKSWYGDLNDQVLVGLEKFLLQMAAADVDDVRPFMKQHIENDPEKGILIVH